MSNQTTPTANAGESAIAELGKAALRERGVIKPGSVAVYDYAAVFVLVRHHGVLHSALSCPGPGSLPLFATKADCRSRPWTTRCSTAVSVAKEIGTTGAHTV